MNIRVPRPIPNAIRERAAAAQMIPVSEAVADLRKGVTDLAVEMAARKRLEPMALCAERTFEPEAFATTVNGVASHYIIRDGMTYTIAMRTPASWVFEAHSLVVELRVRFREVITGWVSRMPIPQGGVLVPGFTPRTTYPGEFLTPASQRPFAYFWNIRDMASGYTYSDELVSHAALLPPTYYRRGTFDVERFTNSSGDGGVLDFDCPWRIQPSSQVQFEFRPVMSILQTAAAGITSGRQDVTVSFELHGFRRLEGVR